MSVSRLDAWWALPLRRMSFTSGSREIAAEICGQEMSTKDPTPTYIAQCPECAGLIAASVADVESQSVHAALRDRAEWQKAGYQVRTIPVYAVQSWPPDGFGHRENCSRRKVRQYELLADNDVLYR